MAEGDTTKTVSAEDFTKLQTKLDHAQAKWTDLEKQLGRYAGIDPDAVKAKLEDYEILRKEKAKGNPEEIDKLLKDKEAELTQAFEKRYGKKFEEQEAVSEKQAAELKHLRVTSVVMKEAGESFHPSTLDLIESVVTKDCDWDADGIVIKGEDGKPLMSPADPRRRMDAKEYVATLVGKYEACAKPTALKGGKGSTGEKGAPNLTGIKSLADAARLPDKGKAAFSSMQPEQIIGMFPTNQQK